MNAFVSDETLHAYVDGELDQAEREALAVRIQGDPELAQRVCALRSLKDMLKLAYAEPPAPQRRDVARAQGGRLQRCALGCLVLGTGLVVGWMLRGAEPAVATAQAPFEAMPGLQTVSLARVPDPDRMLLHVDTAAPDRMQATLDRAERLLDKAEREGRQMQMEIIANSNGLDLLRAGRSPHAARIANMQARHANLHWVACSQSIARFIREGQRVELLPAVRTAPTAIGEIVTRLQQGWTYVRV